MSARNINFKQHSVALKPVIFETKHTTVIVCGGCTIDVVCAAMSIALGWPGVPLLAVHRFVHEPESRIALAFERAHHHHATFHAFALFVARRRNRVR